MSTNQPHPCAVDAAPLLNLGRLEYHFITRRPPIHIYGRMLSLIFRPDLDDPVGEPLIVVFDWVAGVEVGKFHLPKYSGYSIAFISEEYFIIPQDYTSKRIDHINGAGKIDLFYSPICDKETPTRYVKHVASFAFPPLHEDQNGLSLYAHVAPSFIPDTPYWSVRLKTVPRIYEQNSWNHLCLCYEALDEAESLQPSFRSRLRFSKDIGTSGLLFVAFQPLLNLFDWDLHTGPNDPVSVPWEFWRCYTVCLTDAELPCAFVCGRKYIFLRNDFVLDNQDQTSYPISVLELEFRPFSQERATNTYECADVVVSGQNTGSSESSNTYILQCPAPARGSYQHEKDLPDLRAYCKKTTWNLDEEIWRGPNHDDIMASNEHLVKVVEHSDDDSECGAYIYSL
ncbi:hypothetical protein RSOLAG1IB_01810 [Rhizoctonia solani AG-1 IB]|uniref:Uncharacterized protein n=1 Tax=Thanatephorus cucumeris (strain AG1-IB / isolate 7/3/14) TaxID=1108050 RepID=A0A0B7FHU5_THACB|nr:hypothetical protein RSOLAG1IB_01810 [Rhizoctonia solani AG-1 IB]